MVFLTSYCTRAEVKGVAREPLFSDWQGADNDNFAVVAAALVGFDVPILV